MHLPALLSLNLTSSLIRLQLYWVGPLVGGALAAWIYELVFATNATPAKLRGFFTRSYDNDDFDRHGRRSGTTETPVQKLT